MSTWYRFVRLRGWRRPRLRVHPQWPTEGLRAARPNEIWHVDTPLLRLLDGTRAYTTWFDAHRPHQGLGGRTPDGVFTGRSRPPTSVPLRAVLEVRHIDGNRDRPALRLRHAA